MSAMGHYTVIKTSHVFIDGLHWIRFCPKCQADLAKIEMAKRKQ